MKFQKPCLENLSTSEIAALACASGIEIYGALDRNALLRELLEDAAENSGLLRNRSFADAIEEQEIENEHIQNLENKPKTDRGRANEYELAKLPLNYGMSVIYAIVRDPLWVFVCWELLTGKKKNMERRPNFRGYLLKVREKAAGEKNYSDFYSVSVGNKDSAWYLHFTPSGGTFRVELCARLGAAELVLATTGDFTLPRMLVTGSNELYNNELWQISGIKDFAIIKNIGFKRNELF
ncbi:MAG: DUF4912 domain-containing protein [Spirochaetaceae bacterium]|jgi:hypothetical protein|nr:DUF4912 domain-containing protein [Spirochaetaceae bacterium]